MPIKNYIIVQFLPILLPSSENASIISCISLLGSTEMLLVFDVFAYLKVMKILLVIDIILYRKVLKMLLLFDENTYCKVLKYLWWMKKNEITNNLLCMPPVFWPENMSETSNYFPPKVHDVISNSADRTYPDVNNTHSSTHSSFYREKNTSPSL